MSFIEMNINSLSLKNCFNNYIREGKKAKIKDSVITQALN
jgi:hypothetical protein